MEHTAPEWAINGSRVAFPRAFSFPHPATQASRVIGIVSMFRICGAPGGRADLADTVGGVSKDEGPDYRQNTSRCRTRAIERHALYVAQGEDGHSTARPSTRANFAFPWRTGYKNFSLVLSMRM